MRSLVVVVLLALAGCPNANTYTTARTLAPGRITFQAAPEAYGGYNSDSSDGSKSFDAFASLPTFGLRAGLTDTIEVGARLANLSSVAGDLKINLKKGKLDIAIDPGVQWYSWEASSTDEDDDTVTDYSGNVFYLSLPLLLGYNLSKDATLVFSPGLTIVTATESDFGADSILGQLGVGFELRASDFFSIFPQLTVSTNFDDADLIMLAGIGFNFGGQPSFADPPAPFVQLE